MRDASSREESGSRDPAETGSRVPWLVYAVALAALVWVFHDISWRALLTQILEIDPRWLLPAVAADILSYYLQGIRWHHLLKPVGRLSSFKATQAIYVGLFANEIVPMRLGEFAVAFLAGRWLRRPIAEVVPSMLVGRLFDGVWLAIATGVLLIEVPLPGNLEWAGDLFALLVTAGVALFLGLLLTRARAVPESLENTRVEPSGLAGKLRGWYAQILRGIRAIRDPRAIAIAALASLGVLVFQALAFWFAMAAYRLPVSVISGVAVFLIVHLGTAIPNAPANVGTFQLFTVLGLGLFGVEKEMAAGFSAVVFLVLTLPLWLIGFLALSQTGLSLRGIRNQLRPTQ